jgi:hypothetical protein
MIVCGLALASPGAAAELRLQIHEGRVMLDALEVPAREILAEWTRVGATMFVNVDRIAGPPLTLHFIDLPEREALDLVLRGISGYLAVVRLAGAPGASAFDRIYLLATSRAVSPPTERVAAIAGVASRPAIEGGNQSPAKQPFPNYVPSEGEESEQTQTQASEPSLIPGLIGGQLRQPPGAAVPGVTVVRPPER